jgi:hypothetical protein
VNELTVSEQSQLADCEAVIEQGFKTFVSVGNALAEIRDAKLYRLTHGTFEEYCQDKWDMGGIYARRLIAAADVVDDLMPIGIKIPMSESVARPLTSLPPEDRRAVWQQAAATAPKGRVTAAHVAAVVAQHRSSQLTDAHQWATSQLERKAQAEAGFTVHANMRSDELLIEWAKSQGIFVRVDRATEWGNPFLLPDDGDRETVINNYDWYLDRKPSLLAKIHTLKGKVLGCWCHPEACHAGILEGRAND